MESYGAPLFLRQQVVYKTFSKRQAELRGDVPDVYTYDDLPFPLRVQLFQAIEQGLGGWSSGGNPNHLARARYEKLVNTLRREYGTFHLNSMLLQATGSTNIIEELKGHILEAPTEQVLDAVELSALAIAELIAEYKNRTYSTSNQTSSLAEINYRFREHGIGYEFLSGQIVRIDSELVHAETVKPALSLLREKRYSGAQQEFLSAYEHYRVGKTKEALTDALKAIESTMKVICDKRGWTFADGDSSKKLIDICLQNGLIPPYWQSHFSSLRSMLESSVPTARNKNGAHGQGLEIQTVPDYLASYVLHMTASTIVFLVKAEQALP